MYERDLTQDTSQRIKGAGVVTGPLQLKPSRHRRAPHTQVTSGWLTPERAGGGDVIGASTGDDADAAGFVRLLLTSPSTSLAIFILAILSSATDVHLHVSKRSLDARS